MMETTSECRLLGAAVDYEHSAVADHGGMVR